MRGELGHAKMPVRPGLAERERGGDVDSLRRRQADAQAGQ
jgi:hypothetical protein